MNPRIVPVAVLALLALTACSPKQDDDHTASDAKPKTVVIDTAKLSNGPTPKIGWIDIQGVHVGRRTIPLTGDEVSDVAIFGDDIVVVAQLANGDAEVQVRDSAGAMKAHFTHGVTRLVTNSERNIVGWSDKGGVVWVLQTGHDQPLDLTHPSPASRPDESSPLNPIAITGHDCFKGPEEVEGGGCSFYFTAYNAAGKGAAMVASSHGFTEKASRDISELNDVSPSGALVGLLNPTSHRLCSVYEPRQDAKRAYGRCDMIPSAFSPAGDRYLAFPARITEGPATDKMTVRDAKTGKVQLTIRSPKKMPTIYSTLWEDDSHVLAVIAQDEKPWSIVRIGLDGEAELAHGSKQTGDNLANAFTIQP